MLDRPSRLTRKAFRHFRSIPTRWMDNDAFRHVNNVVYYSFFDTVVTGYYLENGLFDAETSPFMAFVAETGCTYFESLAFPETVDGGLAVARMGRSSVRYSLGIFKAGAELAAAQGHFVHVYVDRASQRPVPIPAGIRTALAMLEEAS